MTEPSANHVFEYFQNADALQERPDLDAVLHGLAKQFAATALGVCSLSDLSKNLIQQGDNTLPKKFPWQTDGKLLSRIRAALGAEPHHDAAGEWLIAAVMAPQRDETFFAWILRPQPNWSEADRWQWTYASQALVRWYFEEAIKTEGQAVTQGRLESAATVSSRLIHEFGNFLTGIMGFTELAQSRAAADHTLAMYLQEVMLSANQGADWIRRLHRFCQRGRGMIWPTHLASLLQALEAREPGLNLQLQIDAPADLPLLEIDSASLQAILQELANNSREATRDQASLSIKARVKEMSAADCQATLGTLLPGPCVEIVLADNGPGFSAEARAKLFHDLFYSSKPRHRGTGLLAVYGAMRRFQGSIALDFAPATPGACVRLYVPIAKLPDAAKTSGKPAQVLLVHSDTTLLESMRVVLASSGLRVSTANTSAAGMSTYQLTKPSFNLVIAETTMPRVSGFELARRIMDHHPKAQFLFLNTQSSSYYDAAEVEMLKGFAILRWPMATAEFIQAVDHALTHPAS